MPISRRGISPFLSGAAISRGRRLTIEHLEPRALLAAFDVLVFSKTAGFRHSSIEPGIAAIQALAAAHDFSVTATEDATAFNSANLANYDAVVFLSTTGDVLDAAQEAALQQYIQNGGGWVGVHSAADTEHGWDWYGQLVGAYFQSHPAIQTATIEVADQVHASTAHLPDRWVRTDEWYNFTSNPRGNVHVLATLDEATYSGGADGHDHPIAWYHDFQGGRSWYTALGHTDASYAEPLFLDHLLGGIRYAAGQVPSDGGATVNANFQKVVVEETVNNGLELAVAPDGRVFFIETLGRLKVYDPTTQATTIAGSLSVYTANPEHGLLGLTLDPHFTTNHWLYLYYSPSSTAVQRLSRFTMIGNTLDMTSEKILLSIPTTRLSDTSHLAGSLAFGPNGELYLSTGDDTNPHNSSGYAPLDERPGRLGYDSQKSASNANDLRGKILRIIPQADGTYTIPAGNLFPADGSAGLPEIFVMGNRNPYRISIDAKTGWLYWGEVGPDASNDNAARGPRGYDELNQARAPGNFGWPYAIADNKPYRDFDFATAASGPAFNPAALANNSPNNTGPQNLPPAQPAMVWYPYAASAQFPEVGSGARTIMAGPVYHFDPNLQSERKLPAYYDGTLFMYDWSRSRIWEVKLDDSGNLLKINNFSSAIAVARPIDMELGPDGALYILEWGTTYNGNNADARLVRVDFLGSPQIISADFDASAATEGGDFLAWQRGFGIPGAADRADGDANVDGAVDAQDLAHWEAGFGAASSAPLAADFAASALEAEGATGPTRTVIKGNIAEPSPADAANLLPSQLWSPNSAQRAVRSRLDSTTAHSPRFRGAVAPVVADQVAEMLVARRRDRGGQRGLFDFDLARNFDAAGSHVGIDDESLLSLADEFVLR